jgi:hypothetical protein
MKQELSTIDWEEKLSTQDENKQWKFFKDTVLCIQVYCQTFFGLFLTSLAISISLSFTAFRVKLFTLLHSLQYSLYLSPSRVSINLDQHRCFLRITFKVFKSMLVLPFLSVAALDLRFGHGVYLS